MFKHDSFDRGRRALLGAGGAMILAAALRPAGALAQSAGGAKMQIGIIGSGTYRRHDRRPVGQGRPLRCCSRRAIRTA